MSSALKQPVLPPTGSANTTSGTNTNIANSSLGINKNIQQSALSSLSSPQVGNKNLSQPSNMQVGNAAPLSVNRNFQQTGSMQHNIPSAQGYSSQITSHTNQNIMSAHQQTVPNMAHQQTVQSMQQVVTAHQVHSQVAQDMQPASLQFNKPVNCSSTTVSGTTPSPVNMVQERASNIHNQPVQQPTTLPTTTNTVNTSSSLTAVVAVSSSTSTSTVTSSQPQSVPLSSLSSPSSTSTSTSASSKLNTGNTTENTLSTTVPAPSLVKPAQSNGTVDTTIKSSVENVKDEKLFADSQTSSQTIISVENTESDVTSVEKDDNNSNNKEDTSPKPNKKETAPVSSTNIESSQKTQSSAISSSNVSPTQSSNVPTTQVQITSESTSTNTVQQQSSSLNSSNSVSTVSNQSTVQNNNASTNIVKTPPKSTDLTTSQKTTPSRTPLTLKVGTIRTTNKRKRDSVSKSPKSTTNSESPSKIAKVDTPTTPRNHNKMSNMTNKISPSTDEQMQKSGKRVRVRTQPYQSPLPEMALISKLSATPKRSTSVNDDKLIAFYKNEFLAVRNTEGGFYVCQAVQNVYKTSSRIRIRWLSNQDKTTDIYTPDFYDFTEFDCILTNLSLDKLEKGKFRLPKDELERTESILKRALDVEKGIAEASESLTEEHPDGLDLSLLRDENQLKKRKSKANSAKSRKRKSPESKTEKPAVASKIAKVTTTKQSPKRANRSSISKTTTPKSTTPKKATTPSSSNTRGKKVVAKKSTPKSAPTKKRISKTSPAPKKVASASAAVNSKKEIPATAPRSQRLASRRGDNKTISLQTSPTVDANKAKVLAKVAGRKTTANSSTASKTPAPKSNEKKAVATRGTKSVPASSGRGTRSSTNVPQTPTSSRRQIKRGSKK